MDKKENNVAQYPDFNMYKDQLENPQMFMAVYAGPEMMSNMGPAAGFVGAFVAAEAMKQDAAPAAQRYCADCGTAIPTTAKFCPDCGKKQPAPVVCPRCGAMILPQHRFCIECGEVVKKEE